MRWGFSILTGAVLWAAPFVCADPVDDLERSAHDVFILGETHDNPEHHAVQTRLVERLEPTAVVFEMLTQSEADALDPLPRDPDVLKAAFEGFHWNNIADYVGILTVSPVIVGAAPEREVVNAAFSDGAAEVFGDEANRFGLDAALPKAEQERREALQFDAHCEAMPPEMMGGMVEAQRLRDAAFARTTLSALEMYGAPVVLITGNGHARSDWGVPSYIARAAPQVKVLSLGQGEDGAEPAGRFDRILTNAPPVERPDPCAAFR